MSQMQKLSVGPKTKAGKAGVLSVSLACRFKLGNHRLFQIPGLVRERERKCGGGKKEIKFYRRFPA